MTDDFLSRAYADNHTRMSDQIAASIGRLIDTIRVSLARVHRYEFDAPWQRNRCA